jgi:hypothetical protein
MSAAARTGSVAAGRQRGIASIELALILSAVVFLLIPTFLIARAYWQYTVLKHATYDAARYVAAVPLSQLAATSPEPISVAQAMVAKAAVAAGLVPASEEATIASQVEVHCPGLVNCKPNAPDTITVGAYMVITAPWSSSFGGNGWTFLVFSTVRYGN